MKMPPNDSKVVRARDRLRSSTQQLHQQTESQLHWDQVFSSRASYQRFLLAMLRIVIPADAAIDRQLVHLKPEWVSKRRTAAWLEEDLQNLGDSPPSRLSSTQAADFDFVDTLAKAAGVAYVLEGSAMGGAILAKSLDERLHISADNGGKYLYGYGKQTGSHWGAVTSWLDAVLTEEKQIEEAADAAARTFAIFGDQLSEFR
ncbi:biliverdin-producing heme oxygenase [Blastopirellula sp. J2-11]|uniref:biliverdin-producing heme oxygenase n=1 Tax=Blastopirellula sp. J2-11 TaxID=2943192 RepID=UPI0021CA03D3|nr:biliverdin-producing heme oxygenase [Blastopirellula sp. J2-11]UUO05048.1 biliverdin-producing heme oxygenase [Blastopirellula sp. J2-11]